MLVPMEGIHSIELCQHDPYLLLFLVANVRSAEHECQRELTCQHLNYANILLKRGQL